MKVKERIERQVDLVMELVKELEKEKSYRGIERLVQLTIQALLDLGLMVIVALGGRTPKRYSEVGKLLSDLNVLSESDGKLLKSMAGMRNILVHAYTIIRRDLITESSEKIRDDAPRIARSMKSSLQGRDVDPSSTTDLKSSLSKVFKGKVKAALFFGGRTKGYLMKGDYDIAVHFGRPFNLYELGELAADAAEALNVQEDKLDMICLDMATPELVLEALNGKPIYVEDDYILFELRVKALMDWLDLKTGTRTTLS